ncbi:SAM-dependent methyltransferase [Bifidobacterium subtile]|uniref:Putative DNA N6-adenine methyltransferase n=1 Tax=Bifidobacterium subtile TaxID=77635 RepID=A0A087E895_9BIFI|nr:SAM-dependent methyltransferase [Bifidobacterium subtile]KFJ03996.1 putative DNA N6-adenine methyltransferase [Bifidobacterium subtile]QOL35969.1 SAM-dependent methyltransferase [Bifidobacterium subtile]
MNLERYYTPPEIAARLISLVEPSAYASIIEPSAGDGAILKALKSCGTALPPVYAYDLAPAAEGIQTMNWLEPRDAYGNPRKNVYMPMREKAQRWHHSLVIGNPPFSLAEKFIRESLFADTIAFILPKSFMKSGHAERIIGAHHHVQTIEEVPETARYRLPDGLKTYVPTCICIFEWQATARQETHTTECENFSFVKDPSMATFAIIRVGGKAGTVLTLAESATYSRETLQYVNGDSTAFYECQGEMQHIAAISTGAKIINQREIREIIARSESTASI